MLFKKRKKKTNTPNPVKPRLNETSSFAVKEAYNAIRTKLMFSGKGEICPVFAVTSALAGDGKSTNAVSIAVSFALAGQRVLLIDDIVTTGATLSEAARTLRAAGAADVVCAALAGRRGNP